MKTLKIWHADAELEEPQYFLDMEADDDSIAVVVRDEGGGRRATVACFRRLGGGVDRIARVDAGLGLDLDSRGRIKDVTPGP